jgi:allophanate hydrolase subunit 2
VRAEADLVVVTTGARPAGCPAHDAPVALRAGATLRLGTPAAGLRTYLAVRGGIAVEPVLGSRSTDLLAGLGPPALQAGDVLPVGAPSGAMPGVDVAPVPDPPGGEVSVRLLPGPRSDWLTDDALDELPSEGLVRGALQVPPSGTPVLFLADAPVTGGYPVAGYVADGDVDRCAQLRPGQTLRLRR